MNRNIIEIDKMVRKGYSVVNINKLVTQKQPIIIFEASCLLMKGVVVSRDRQTPPPQHPGN